MFSAISPPDCSETSYATTHFTIPLYLFRRLKLLMVPRNDGPQSGLAHTAKLIRDGKGKHQHSTPLTAVRKIAVLTGAGISTSAGIPDFRSPGTGLYDNLAALNLPFPEAVFSLDYFEVRPEPFWTLAKDLYPGKYFPTPTHYFLALLHRKGLLQRVWTQNIDTLETAAGVPDDLVLEAHGSFRTARCLTCEGRASTEHVLASGVREGKVVKCERDHCDGLVKPDIVFFGEGLPDDFFIRQRELRKADLVLVIGTSLQVMPFAGLVDLVPPDVPRFLINREAVGPFEDLEHDERDGRDALWLGDADAAVQALAEAVGWGEELEELVSEGRSKLKRDWAEREKLGAPAKAEPAAAVEGEKEAEKDKAQAVAEADETPVQMAQHAMAEQEEKDGAHAKEAGDKDGASAKETGDKASGGAAKSGKPTTVEDADDVDALTEGVQRIGLDKAKV